MHDEAIRNWLLDSDPAISWQMMQDILDLAETIYGEERKKIE